MFCIAGQHRRIFAVFLAFSCDFRSSECVLASLAKELFRIVFPETDSGTGTAGTVFQEPKTGTVPPC